MIRTTRPHKNDKYFVRKASGGYSTCIQGKPTDKECDVLSNCVGYANGAFNEELGLGYEKYHLNCNAENFIERAIAAGLSVVQKPVKGAIMCWQGEGSLAGHVAICTEVINDNCVKTAESGYGDTVPFRTATRYNNNGRWGLSTKYPFRGFIVNPNYPVQPKQEDPFKGITDEELARRVWAGEFGNGDARKAALGSRYSAVQALVNQGIGKPEPKPEPPKPEPTPSTEIIAGDIVTVSGRGNASASGTSRSWTRNYTNKKMKVILVSKGAPYPYACNQYGEGKPGRASDVTGWFAAKDITK